MFRSNRAERAEGERKLFQIGADNGDEIVGGFLRRFGVSRHMVADVILHQFGHQTIDSAAGGGEALQHFRALFVLIESAKHRFELADDFFGAVYQVRFLFGGVRHPLSTLTGYSTQRPGRPATLLRSA